MNEFEYILLSLIIAVWQCYNIHKIQKLEKELKQHRGFIRRIVEILHKATKEDSNENGSNENN